MGYLEYQQEDLINLNKSLNIEYLTTNKAGSYACSTIINCNTRKYHGLLVCPLEKIDGDKYVLLSSLDETIIDNSVEFNLGIHKYPNEFNPLGHKYATHFISDITPTITYRIGDLVLKKEFLLVEEDERILIKYTLEDAPNTITLRLKPYLAFRKVHDLTHANLDARVKFKPCENGIISRLYDAFPDLHLQLSSANEFYPAPDWYNNIEYEKELDRGYAFREDLFVPGFFEVPLKKGGSVIFSAGLNEIKTSGLKRKFSSELKKKLPRDNYFNCLENAAHQFIAKKNNRTEIIACYPWYGNWGRDSLIAIPGLTLARGEHKICKDALDTITSDIKGSIFHSIGNDDHHDVDSVDTPLWYAWTVQQYLISSGDATTVTNKYFSKIEEIIHAYTSNVAKEVQVHDNGLVFIPKSNKPLTWMDAESDGNAIINRNGYVIEINALWYNTVSFAAELAEKIKNKKKADEYGRLKDKIESSFSDIFWSEEHKYCADFVNEDYKDFTVRPNQVFACSLPYTPIDALKQKSIIEKIENELLTPKGLRSLSPLHPNYKGSCSGTVFERAFAYHQGSAWPWLLGPFAEAYLKLHKKTGVSKIKRILGGMEKEMHSHGIGSIAEIYDGNPPHQQRGSISQAWNVAELLRIRDLIHKLEENKLTTSKTL